MNQLDELNGQTMDEGRDVNVIAKRIAVEASFEEKLIPVALSLAGIAITAFGLIIGAKVLLLGLILPIYAWIKMKSCAQELMQLEQKLQARASEVDNYMEQRVVVLENLSRLIEKSIDLDKTTFIELSKYRSGNFSDETRNEAQSVIGDASRNINLAFEAYPELKSQAAIADASQQNNYLQREITAARSAYNDTVLQWNRDIFEWPFKKIIAAKHGYTTRIPFITTKETKEKARGVFF